MPRAPVVPPTTIRYVECQIARNGCFGTDLIYVVFDVYFLIAFVLHHVTQTLLRHTLLIMSRHMLALPPSFITQDVFPTVGFEIVAD